MQCKTYDADANETDIQVPLNSCAISNGPVSTTAKHHEISWRRYASSKMILRVTALSNQALVEIIMDMEVLLSKPVPILHPTSPHPRPTIVQRANKAIVKYPHGSSEEEVYQLAFHNEQIAQAAMVSMRAYFSINPATPPISGACVKRPRPQSQSQQPRRQQPMPQMYDFANPGYPHQHHPIPPSTGQPQMYPTYPSTSTSYIPPLAEPVPQAPSPGYAPTRVHPAIPTTRTSPIQPKPAVYPTPPITVPSPVREPSPPIVESPMTETQNEVEVETQPFLETQYSPPKSSSSSCEKPTNAQIQRSSIPESSDETQDELNPSSGAVRDLLSLDDEYDTGLGDHPALDPYEGMPWSRGLDQGHGHVQGQTERAISRPNRYIDAGVYSMTEDQLDGIIGEIVLETGFQGMCERIYRVMDARYLNEEREEMYDEDAF